MWHFFILCLCVRMASVTTDSTVTLLEQKPRWGLVRRGQAVTLRCILKNSQYPWMSWYQQDLQQQLQWLFSLRSSGDKEAKSLPGADYLATRVTDTELRLQVANMTQGRTLFCTCSIDTVAFYLPSHCLSPIKEVLELMEAQTGDNHTCGIQTSPQQCALLKFSSPKLRNICACLKWHALLMPMGDLPLSEQIGGGADLWGEAGLRVGGEDGGEVAVRMKIINLKNELCGYGT
ncbi:uncharacterized protein LOC119807402 [Arvicola amphibius]|uniref:uncharacterized protein LOC119807402 n=1 Tax=Arvicola amphibius TaxID=1047088 RepID=UPI001C090378|nr:uncharacterized protein LOC119807402 [Arvicola amphibius]